MRRRPSVTAILPGVTLLAALASTGFVAPKAPPQAEGDAAKIGFRVIRPAVIAGHHSFSELAGQKGQVEVDARSGAPRIISGRALTRNEALIRSQDVQDFVDVAMSYVQANSATLGFLPSDLALNSAATLLDKDVQFLKFHVMRDGLVVRDAVVDFRFKRGELVQVVNQSFVEAKADKRPAQANGLELAAARSLLASEAERQGEEYRVIESSNGYQLVRVALFDVRSQDGRLYKVAVEAANGKVFEIRPTSFFLNGSASGSVYPRTYYNDLEATYLPYRDAKLKYDGGSVYTGVDGSFTGAPNGSQPKISGLEGKYVKVAPVSGTKFAASGSSSGGIWNILYTKGSAKAYEDKVMAQSMTYYHLNKEISHAKQYISAKWLDQQLTANVNLYDTCNAYWDGQTVNLFSAGDGCANTGLIADVFYHEWGHGLDENTGGIEDGAFSEGFGDTMSLVMTHSNLLGKGFIVEDGSPVRDLTTLKVYPDDVTDEVHDEGQIIGGAFWDLFVGLKEAYGEDKAGDLLSKFALKVIFTASKYTDVYAALLVIDGDSADQHSPNFCIVNKAFARHGLATADTSCP